jgi:competence protein ComEC
VYVSTPTVPEISAFYILLIWSGLLLKYLITRCIYKAPLKMPLLMKVTPVIIAIYFTINGAHLYIQGVHHKQLSLTAVDVGQGNSILIRLPGGQKMLVDGGGFFDDSFDLGKLVLAPYLWNQRISRIDTVVLTHPHPDHLQGLLFILENFHVREVWTNGEESDTELYLTFRRIIREKGIVMKTVSDRTPAMNVDGAGIVFLNPEGTIVQNQIPDPFDIQSPPAPLPSASKSAATLFDATNDRSLAMTIAFGDIRFLLPADITEGVEKRLVHAGVDLQSDVIFIPHHGSNRSNSAHFIEKIKPKIAVVSCGAENVFGFPHPDVLRRYESIKAEVYRTDRDGAVTLTTDGRKLTVSAFGSERR